MDEPITKISYADECSDVETSCDCVPLSTAKYELTSTTTVLKVIALGGPATVMPLYQPAWAVGAIVGNDLVITGTAPTGSNALVYEVSNECSKACITVILTVTGACSAQANIVTPIQYKSSDNSVLSDIPIPADSEILSASVGSASASIYGSTLNISGLLQPPVPATYSVSLRNECGTYTVSGNIDQCVAPRIYQVIGSSTLEKGVATSYGWVIEATGNVTVRSSSGMPAGMSYSVAQNTPSVGLATVSVSGTPVEDPCPSGTCENKLTVFSNCGQIELSRKIIQQPCRAVQVIGSVGESSFALGEVVNYCKIVSGYEPTIADFTDVPIGLAVTVSPDTVAGQWKVCLTGTVLADPCNKETGIDCRCAKVSLKNKCGTKEIEICTAISRTPVPKFCIGLVTATELGTAAPGTREYSVQVVGVTPNSEIELFHQEIGTSGNVSPSVKVMSDALGNYTGTVVLALTGGSHCLHVKHQDCVLIAASKELVQCPVVVTDPGGGGPP